MICHRSCPYMVIRQHLIWQYVVECWRIQQYAMGGAFIYPWSSIHMWARIDTLTRSVVGLVRFPYVTPPPPLYRGLASDTEQEAVPGLGAVAGTWIETFMGTSPLWPVLSTGLGIVACTLCVYRLHYTPWAIYNSHIRKPDHRTVGPHTLSDTTSGPAMAIPRQALNETPSCTSRLAK